MFPTEATTFAQLFENNQLLSYVVVSVLNGVLLYLASLKFLLVLQQSGYRGKRYFSWLSHRDTPYMNRLMLLCLLALLFFCVLGMCFSPITERIFDKNVGSYIGFISYVLFVAVYINTESHVNAKVPLKKTKRLVRLAVTYIIILSAVTFGLMVLLTYIAYLVQNEIIAMLRFSVICIMPIFIPFVLYFAGIVNEPFELFVRKNYIRKARQTIENSDVIKIGITGSYGKTSTKEILRTILSQKYRVLSTPESYNTPLGIALTAKKLDGTHDVFIAEMGARSKGDIEEISDIVKPKYGILTGINDQHLETFRTIDNIKETKYELFENLTADGAGFFSSDNEGSVELYEKFGGEKYFSGISDKGNLVTAKDIRVSSKGTDFTLCIKGEKPVKCYTVLLGKHSISNICLAASVAYKIGLSASEIGLGINRIKSVGHRLELMPNNKNMIIIDDSYNANVDGVRAAMEVLDTFKGRKIVLTPGLVELGKEENVANFEMGKTLAHHADIVIVIGRHNAEMLIDGLIDAGFDRNNIVFAKTLNKGNEELNAILKEGDVVLFENDLPDNYN